MTLIEWLENSDRFVEEIEDKVRGMDFSDRPNLNEYSKGMISQGMFEFDYIDSQGRLVIFSVYRGGGYTETFGVSFEDLL